MLVELVVENYAVVERVRVRFHAGLNLLTGETGSGKSIVVDALGLLYGGRASADMVRSGAGRARIAGIFEEPSSAEFRALLERNGVEIEDGELLIEREILANGKSRAFLGSRPVTAALLKDLAPHLGDIHGQHDQQELFLHDSQLAMVDSAGETGEAVTAAGAVFTRWQAVTREFEELDRGEQEKLRLADLWSFQKREIEEAALKPGEEAGLENERKVQGNVARLQEAAQGAYAALYEAQGSALAQVKTARKRLEELCRIDASLRETMDSLKPAEITLDEASHTLRHYLGTLEAEPARLERVESRLAAIDKLKRKYGASVDEILTFLAQVTAQLAAIETAGERRAQLAAERTALAADYERAARKLSQDRRQAAAKLEAQVQEELAALAMAGTVFRVEFTEGAWTARGIDRVRFLVSPNRGEEPRPLEKVASGGELSRLALALKTCLTVKKKPKIMRTLVFDEVDSGVGGRTAESVGRRLKKLAASNQLLCVTHLPQIAGFGDHHYVVEKQEVNGRTQATIEELSGEARTREIGRMLSGERMTLEALKNAEQLLKLGSGR